MVTTNLLIILSLFFPGLFLLFLKKVEEDFLLKFILIISFSFSYWIITFWLLYFSIFKYWLLISIISSIFLALFLFYKNKKLKIEIDHILFFFFIIFGFFRFIPMFLNEAAPGGDITMHTYNTLLITIWQKIPEDYQPIFNMKGFGAQPQGFSILSAIFSFLGKIPPYKATFFLSCFTYFLLLGGFYALLRTRFDSQVAFLTASIITFFCRGHQNFYLWGGTPTILAFFFSLLSYYFFIKEIENPTLSFFRIFLLAFLISAGFLTHFIPMAVFILILIVITLYKLITIANKRNLVVKIIFTGILIFIFSLPYFIVFKKVNTSEKEWQVIFDWNVYLWKYEFLSQFIPHKLKFLWVFIKIIYTTGILPFILALMGMISLIKKKKFYEEIFLSFFTIITILCFNLFWKIKLTQIFYPERTSLYFLFPFGLLIGEFLSQLNQRSFKKYLLYFCLFLFFNLAILSPFLSKKGEKTFLKKIIRSLLAEEFYKYLFVKDNYSLTKNDLEAFLWIKNNCPDGIILTNYSDGGVWLPAILGRPSYLAHIVFNLFDEYEKFIKNTPVEEFKYLYIGSKNVGENIFFTKKILEKENKKVEKIYEKGGVSIYKIKEPSYFLERIFLHRLPN